MTMQGIDCASYQAGIDPSAVPCDFVIVKSTQGTTYTNPDFQRLAEATLAAGKALGIYHYASGGNATDEANHMLDVAGGYIGKAILCLDWEGVQNKAFGSGRDSAWIDEFCSVIEGRAGSSCLVYISKSVMHHADGHKLWVAQYANMNRTGYQDHPWNEGAYDCTIRQYTSMGRLDGWSGDLDLDKAYMSREEWDAWAAGNGAPASAPQHSVANGGIAEVQSWLGCKADGIYGPDTKRHLVKTLQHELNAQFGAGLIEDGIWGPKTKAACVNVRRGAKGNITRVLQGALICHGYGTNGFDGIFGGGTGRAVRSYQSDRGLSADGIAGKNTFASLLG